MSAPGAPSDPEPPDVAAISEAARQARERLQQEIERVRRGVEGMLSEEEQVARSQAQGQEPPPPREPPPQREPPRQQAQPQYGQQQGQQQQAQPGPPPPAPPRSDAAEEARFALARYAEEAEGRLRSVLEDGVREAERRIRAATDASLAQIYSERAQHVSQVEQATQQATLRISLSAEEAQARLRNEIDRQGRDAARLAEDAERHLVASIDRAGELAESRVREQIQRSLDDLLAQVRAIAAQIPRA